MNKGGVRAPLHVVRLPFLLGRLVCGGFFFYSGIDHFRNQQKLTEYAASKGVPFPGTAVTAAVMTLAGLSSTKIPDSAPPNWRSSPRTWLLLGAGLGLLAIEEPWPVSVPEQQQPAALRRLKRAARSLVAA